MVGITLFQRLWRCANNKPTLMQFLSLLGAAVMTDRVDNDQAYGSQCMSISESDQSRTATHWILTVKSRGLLNPLTAGVAYIRIFIFN